MESQLTTKEGKFLYLSFLLVLHNFCGQWFLLLKNHEKARKTCTFIVCLSFFIFYIFRWEINLMCWILFPNFFIIFIILFTEQTWKSPNVSFLEKSRLNFRKNKSIYLSFLFYENVLNNKKKAFLVKKYLHYKTYCLVKKILFFFYYFKK